MKIWQKGMGKEVAITGRGGDCQFRFRCRGGWTNQSVTHHEVEGDFVISGNKMGVFWYFMIRLNSNLQDNRVK